MTKYPLFVIVGPSGSGKSTLAEGMVEELGLRKALTYTTRPPRPGEPECDHIFVDELPAEAVYCRNTFAGYEYGTTKEQLDKSDIIIVDPAGVEDLCKHYTERKLVLMYLDCPASVRKRRMAGRGDLAGVIETRMCEEQAMFDTFLQKFACYKLPAQLPADELIKTAADVVDFERYIAANSPNYLGADARRPLVIAVDFDGCLCESVYPGCGEPNMQLIVGLMEMQRQGRAKVILNTCRCGESLQIALDWCKMYGLEFAAVNDNLPELIELFGVNCRKISADIYIDDKALRWAV